MSQLYKIYSNLFVATRRTISVHNIPLKIGHLKLCPKSTEKELSDGMENLSLILKQPEFGYLHKFRMNK